METRILVGTADGIHEVGDRSAVSLSGHEVNWLTVQGSLAWVIVDGRELWQSEDMEVWNRVSASERYQANCGAATSDGVFVGTSEAHLLELRDASLETVRAFEDAEGRQTWYTPWGGPPDVRSVSAGPSGVVYVNVHVGGIVRSDDGGRSWVPTIDIHSDVHQVLVDPASGVLAASARGLAVSHDSGESWTYQTDGLHGSYLRAVTVAGETVLVSASTGPYTDRAAVYLKTLASEAPFERCAAGLPDWFANNIDTHCLASSGSAVAFGTSEGDLFASRDEGRNWTRVADGLPSVRCVSFG